MKIWAKLAVALRTGLHEEGTTLGDSQALRILGEEVREATQELSQSKEELAEILAQYTLAEKNCKQLQADIDEYEGYATQVLKKGDQALALEVAQKVAELENLLQVEKESIEKLRSDAESLKEVIKHAEQDIRRIKQQVDTVKATETVIRAQVAVAERQSDGEPRLRTAMDSLEQIKKSQAHMDVKTNAESDNALAVSHSKSLDAKLKAAGIVPGASSAEKVLARLKKK